NENKNLNLQVNHFTGTNVSAVIAPNPPRLDQPANLAVQVTGAVVDPTGIARIAPQPGVQVDLITGPGWELQSPPTGFTGPNGEAVWRVKCTALGNPSLVANVAGVPYPLNVSPCQLPPPSTVPPSPSPSPSTTARVSTTTT